LSALKTCIAITEGTMPESGPVIRFVWFFSGALLIYGLFHFGAQPIAAGLFTPPIDKIAHAAVFGLIAMMLWFVFDRRYPLLVIGLVAMTGAADEIHQLFLPGRCAEAGDWIADVCGACLPIVVLIASRKKCGKSTDAISNSGIKTSSAGLTDEAEGVERTMQA